MKKRTLALILGLVLAFGLTACGGSEDPAPAETNDTTETETAEPAAAEKDFSGDYTDTGAGTIEVITPSGSSADGTVPFVLIEPDAVLVSIELDAWEFDGSKISYIYVDGMLYGKEQLADTQLPFDLQGDMLAEGEHSVEVVQYDNDDPSGNVVVYKSAAYEIKL